MMEQWTSKITKIRKQKACLSPSTIVIKPFQKSRFASSSRRIIVSSRLTWMGTLISTQSCRVRSRITTYCWEKDSTMSSSKSGHAIQTLMIVTRKITNPLSHKSLKKTKTESQFSSQFEAWTLIRRRRYCTPAMRLAIYRSGISLSCSTNLKEMKRYSRLVRSRRGMVVFLLRLRRKEALLRALRAQIRLSRWLVWR